MANRTFQQFSFTLQKYVVSLYAKVTFGANGAPTLVTAQSKGVVSVTKNATGKYTFVFGTTTALLDTYPYLLSVNHVWDESGNSGTAPAAPGMFILANSTATVGTSSLQIEFNAAGTAAEPVSGEAVYMTFVFGNSTAP